MNSTISRRHILQSSAAIGLAASWPDLVRAAETPIITRPIPSSGEQLPIIGVGTFIVFNFKDDPVKFEERRKVIQTLIAGGGKLIDSAARYEEAEGRVGDVVADLKARDKVFLATKCWANDDRAAQMTSMANSLQKLHTDRVDLMQFHVVDNPDTKLDVLREFKAQGKTRYIGFSNSENYAALETVLKREKPDFFQVDYSIGNRDSEDRVLPTARDVGAAVLINLPFGRNALFAKTKGVELPDFAKELGIASWAQFFLKFVVSHPAVNCVIPGTDKPEYMLDNLGAGRGPMPDAAMRKRMVTFWDSLPGNVPFQDSTRGR